jgi:hypothetical protein
MCSSPPCVPLHLALTRENIVSFLIFKKIKEKKGQKSSIKATSAICRNSADFSESLECPQDASARGTGTGHALGLDGAQSAPPSATSFKSVS